MKYYNNIFASSYKYYSGFKYESPVFNGICIVFVCQTTLLIFILILLRKFTVINVFAFLSSKLYFLPFLFIWFYLLNRYYKNKERIAAVIKTFESKSDNFKKLWGAITIVSFVSPVIISAFLLKK